MPGPDKELFIIRIDREHFVVDVHDREILVSGVMSHAKHLGYPAADKLAQSLRRRGHPLAIVSLFDGRPVTLDVLSSVEDAKAVQAASLPTSYQELDKISVTEQRRRYKSDPAFRARFDELDAQPRVAPGKSK